MENVIYYCHCDSKLVRPMAAEKIYYWEGSMTYRCFDTEVTLGRGDAILLPKGTLRERVFTGSAANFVSINFLLYPHVQLDLPWYLPGAITPDLQRLASTYTHPLLVPVDYARERLACLTGYILYELLNRHLYECRNPHVSVMLRTIHERIGEPLTLAELAKTAHISREYAAQIFRRETGNTVIGYINEQKMQLAGEMIREGNMTLPEVAESLGFSNYSYFSRLFKRRFGVSPSRLNTSR